MVVAEKSQIKTQLDLETIPEELNNMSGLHLGLCPYLWQTKEMIFNYRRKETCVLCAIFDSPNIFTNTF